MLNLEFGKPEVELQVGQLGRPACSLFQQMCRALEIRIARAQQSELGVGISRYFAVELRGFLDLPALLRVGGAGGIITARPSILLTAFFKSSPPPIPPPR